MTSVVVFDYGFGNVRSMVRALTNVGADVTLTSDYQQAMQADGVVVPGVGAFAAVMRGLTAVGGDRVIYERLRVGKPVLGVCVGLQILFEHGIEHDISCEGLGLVPGNVELLDAPVVPHMGWNTVDVAPHSVLLQGLEHERFYFVHSYGADAQQVRGHCEGQHISCSLSTCEYGNTSFVAALELGALSATQFHPEKSGAAGAQLLTNWLHSL